MEAVGGQCKEKRRFYMYPIGYFLDATAKVLEIVLELYMWIIIIRALLSWVNPDPYNPIVQFLHSITDPILDRVRRLLPISGIGIDFSPIVIILGIIFLQTFLVNTIARFAMQLQ